VLWRPALYFRPSLRRGAVRGPHRDIDSREQAGTGLPDKENIPSNRGPGRPLRVAVVTTVHVPGDTRIWHKEVGSLAQAGWEVHYLASDLAGFRADDRAALHDLGPRVQTPVARLARIRRAVALVRSLKPDVIHFHDPELLPAMTLGGVGLGASLVYDVHENIREQLRIKPWLPVAARPLVAGCYGLLEAACLRAVRGLVLAEESYAATYAGRDHVVVKNYPILERTAAGPRALPESPAVCYVGGVSVARGALDLLDAFALLAERRSDVSLTLAGPVMPPLTPGSLLARVAGTAAEGRVDVPGRVSLDDAYGLMSASAVGVAPLRAVGNYVGSLPTKMFEYMSCALPVVVSGFPLWRGIVDETGCGRTFTPGDPADLAARIAEVLDDPDAYRAMSARALASVRERFSWEREAGVLLDLYRRIAA